MGFGLWLRKDFSLALRNCLAKPLRRWVGSKGLVVKGFGNLSAKHEGNNKVGEHRRDVIVAVRKIVVPKMSALAMKRMVACDDTFVASVDRRVKRVARFLAFEER